MLVSDMASDPAQFLCGECGKGFVDEVKSGLHHYREENKVQTKDRLVQHLSIQQENMAILVISVSTQPVAKPTLSTTAWCVDVYVMHNRRKCTVFLESPTDGKSTWIYMPILNVPSAKRSLTPKEI